MENDNSEDPSEIEECDGQCVKIWTTVMRMTVVRRMVFILIMTHQKHEETKQS